MIVFKRLPLIMAALLVFACAASCVSGAAPVVREAGKTYELVLLHNNDHHGTVLPNDGRGGLAERASFVKSVRAAHPNVLLVDAGDINTGPALSNMFAAEPDILAYNLIAYDAVTFGNHEFDGTQGKLDKQIAAATFPFVSSNVKTSNTRFLGGNQYLVKDFDGFRVGIIGITTLRTKTIASPDRRLIFVPEIEAARAAVDILKNRQHVDIIIALTHIGDVKETPDHVTSPELARAIPEIDIIVDGHSHSRLTEPLRAGNTWIVSSNEWGKYVGQGKLSIVDGKLVSFDWAPVAINSREQQIYAPDAEVAALLAPYVTRAEASLREVVGEAAETFVFGNRLTRYQETALGNMICDANVWYFSSVQNQTIDFAFHNGGNIRTELPKGPITRERILTILPFDNYLYIVSLKGSELLELFNFIATIPQGSGGFPQFSSEVRYTLDVPNQSIRDLTINGAAIDPYRVYRFITNDYLLGGGDGYTVLTSAGERYNTSMLLSDVIIESLLHFDSIEPYIDGRMTVIGGVTP